MNYCGRKSQSISLQAALMKKPWRPGTKTWVALLTRLRSKLSKIHQSANNHAGARKSWQTICYDNYVFKLCFQNALTSDYVRWEGKNCVIICCCCTKAHKLYMCGKFQGKSVSGKFDFLPSRNVCFVCFNLQSPKAKCLTKVTSCEVCQKRHRTVCHSVVKPSKSLKDGHHLFPDESVERVEQITHITAHQNNSIEPCASKTESLHSGCTIKRTTKCFLLARA